MLETPTLLIVDDDTGNLQSLSRVFKKEALAVLTATSGKEALDLVRAERVHVVITDLMMPGMTGVDLLKSIKTIAPEIDVILMTAYGTVDTAVEAMKEGAYDFITKPFKKLQIVRAVKRALDNRMLLIENRALRERLEELSQERRIVGSSRTIKRELDLVAQIAPSTARVLIQGESGTGKELFAKAIHERSPRRGAPFIAVNCAAIPETILESELFGYERGAFTGAAARKEGRFDLAHRGTLLLDEIGDMPLSVQSKLLRVIQEGEFERLGGTETIKVDVRILASTNKNLREEVARGTFREDLFYRLSVITLTIPPLRDRVEDIPLLAHHFLHKLAKANDRAIEGISREVTEALAAYGWPGNVRELENVMERAVILAKEPIISLDDLPEHIAGERTGKKVITIPIGTPLDAIEKQVILETLETTKGDKRMTAQLLNTSVRTIYRKLEEIARTSEDSQGGKTDELE